MLTGGVLWEGGSKAGLKLEEKEERQGRVWGQGPGCRLSGRAYMVRVCFLVVEQWLSLPGDLGKSGREQEG